MIDYFHTTGCRMRFIANLLDDPASDDCGICDNCTGQTSITHPSVELVAAAEQFLRKRPIELVSRKMYIDTDSGGRKRIPTDEMIEDGRILSMWGDAGWGQLVRDGKEDTRRFDDRLVEALAELVEEWAPDPAPEWVTSVPSLRHPELVPDFAERLARRLDLPYHAAVSRLVERPEQKRQQNSAHQQANVAGAFGITGSIRTSPVLLLDDVADSCWTMTEIGRLLRRAGVPLVYPVALASSAGRD
jgi:ATP-dependent DNA helicase RecQ